MKHLLIVLALISSITSCSQELKRKAFLGVQAENIDAHGVRAVKVFKDESGDLMGIQADDIIIQIDEQEIKYVDDFIAKLSGYRAGDEVEVHLVRDDEILKLAGKLHGRPLEEPAKGSLSYGTVEYDNGRLRSLLNLPPDVVNPPVVYFIQGYSCRSIDIYWNSENRLRQIVDGLVAKGFAVYRVEKPGMGDSDTYKGCDELGFNEEAAAFLAGLRALKESGKVDAERIFLFGHSLGGITAPVIASQEQVKGIINYGSVTSSWFEFLVKREREHGRLRGDHPAEVEASTRAMIPFLQDYLIAKMPERELHANHADYLEFHSTPYLAGRDYSFMQELEEIDITQCLIDCNTSVLAIHAEADFNCIDDSWARHTEYIVNSVRPGQGHWKLLPETSHSFAKVGSLETFMKLRARDEITEPFIDANFNPALIDMIVGWIVEVEES